MTINILKPVPADYIYRFASTLNGPIFNVSLFLNFDLRAGITNEIPVSILIQYRLAGGDWYDDFEFIAQGTPQCS